MPIDLRFVFDTNVIVSALLLKHSVSRQAFDMAFTSKELLLSLAVISELNDVLKRKQFDKYILEEERMEFLAVLVREATLIEITEIVTECHDPRDDKFLELPISGKAACIISGDEDLLVLHPLRGIPIVTPAEFLNYSWPISN